MPVLHAKNKHLMTAEERAAKEAEFRERRAMISSAEDDLAHLRALVSCTEYTHEQRINLSLRVLLLIIINNYYYYYFYQRYPLLF